MEAISTATAGNARALLAQCASPDGIAIEAISTATTGATTGVLGSSSSALGRGVVGVNTATTGTTTGVLGSSSSTQGRGVAGVNTATSGITRGVRGEVASPDGRAMEAISTATTAGNARALWALCASPDGIAIEAISNNGMAIEAKGVGGVKGVAIGPNAGAGLWGVQSSSSPSSVAIYGEGKLQVTGTKNFVQPHPGDAGRNIVFTCLEGNESGTYFRGSARLTGGRAEIAIPEEWRLASEAQGITVQVTPIRSFARLMVFEQSRERIVIAGDQDCEFHYLVNGVRRGYARHVSFVENHQYRPVVKQVPFGMQYPKELRDVLVGNGILNADYTPNEATAARLGWTLKEQHEVPVAERWWLAAEERQALWNAELAERKE
jgi:hypothetical protein